MAYKLQIESSYFVVLDTVSTVEEIREPRDQVKFKVDGTSYRFYPNYPSANRTGIDDGIGRTITEFPFADIVDSTGAAFASQDVLNGWLALYLGGAPSLKTKSGVVSGTSFAGNPKKVTVTFAVPFSDTRYSASVVGENQRNWTIENVEADSFVINANANLIFAGDVYWQCIKHGEN